MGLANKVLLITGAASGMGAACARLFAAAGAQVVIVDRNAALSDEIAQAIRFLASDAASYITRTLLPPDAGYSAV